MATIINARILRITREAKGWDQRELASAAGINPSVISRLERGLQTDLKASVLVALAHALEVPVDTLVMASGHLPEPSLVPHLSAILTEIEKLPFFYQRQVAALLFGYLTTLPPQEEHPIQSSEEPT